VTRRRAGEPRARGRLLVPSGPITLRPDLDASGQVDLVHALRLVHEDWDAQVARGTVSPAVISMYRQASGAMVSFAAAMGVNTVGQVRPNLLVRWVHTPRPDGDPVTLNTRLARRSAARAFFLTAMRLGLTDQNPADAVVETKRQSRYVHSLTDAQVRRLQQCAPHTLTETKTPAALALLLLGAGTREAGHVEFRDVDLLHERVSVHHGGERFRDRWLPIDSQWAAEAITGRMKALLMNATDTRTLMGTALVYESQRVEPTAVRRQAAVSGAVLALMKRARVYEAGVTRPESIREWVAARVFAETESVAAVAERLGMASLDGAAHIVGYDWVSEWSIDVPAPEGRSRRRGQ